MNKKGSCWEGYVQKGMKKKGKRTVPNCVPAMKTGGLKATAMSKSQKASAVARKRQAPNTGPKPTNVRT